MMGSEEGAGGGASGTRSEQEKPVKVGDVLDVTISEMSRRGDGVVRVEGFVVFVPKGTQGQQAKIRVVTVRPNFAVAEIVPGTA